MRHLEQLICIDLDHEVATFAGESVTISEASPSGSLRVAGGPVIRPLSFSERNRIVLRASGAPDPVERVYSGILRAATTDAGETTGCSAEAVQIMALALAGATLEAPSFAASALLVARATGWGPVELAEAEAAEVDRLAIQLSGPPEESGWSRLVFPAESGSRESLRRELAANLLERAVASSSTDFFHALTRTSPLPSGCQSTDLPPASTQEPTPVLTTETIEVAHSPTERLQSRSGRAYGGLGDPLGPIEQPKESQADEFGRQSDSSESEPQKAGSSTFPESGGHVARDAFEASAHVGQDVFPLAGNNSLSTSIEFEELFVPVNPAGVITETATSPTPIPISPAGVEPQLNIHSADLAGTSPRLNGLSDGSSWAAVMPKPVISYEELIAADVPTMETMMRAEVLASLLEDEANLRGIDK
jgi:hypothetical protein